MSFNRTVVTLNAVLVAVIVLYGALVLYSMSDTVSKLMSQPEARDISIQKIEESGKKIRANPTVDKDVVAEAKPATLRLKETEHVIESLCSSSSNVDCNAVHLVVLSTTTRGARNAALLVKSVLIHRSTTIHFHFLVDTVAKVILSELFRTWNVAQVSYSFYNLRDFQPSDKPESLAILQVPKILPNSVEKVIVMNASRILNSDPRQLWCLFGKFKEDQHVGSTIVEDSIKTEVILLQLNGLRRLPWVHYLETAMEVFSELPAYKNRPLQAAVDGLLKQQPQMFFPLPCEWSYELTEGESSCSTVRSNGIKTVNSIGSLPQHDWKIYLWTADYNGNHLRDALPASRHSTARQLNGSLSSHLVELADQYRSFVCSDYVREFVDVFRTHLYYMDFDYTPDNTNTSSAADVTLVTQVSISRISALESLCGVWPGPISAAIYLKDSDARHFESYVLHSRGFAKRKNIAFHLVYEEGSQYPTNHLRNVAAMYIKTPYAFLLDVDFMPVKDVYSRIRHALDNRHRYSPKTAFVVPAFETDATDHTVEVPKSRQEMISLWDKGVFFQFRLKVYKEGHRSTNYSAWRNATEPYQIQWEYGYEPYLVVPSTDIPHYNERFMGYGGDKVSHVMEVAAMGYSFVVLPDVFIVHLPHGVSFDSIRFRSSLPMMNCMKILLEDFGKELLFKYGNNSLFGWQPTIVPPQAKILSRAAA